jgi:hypothetical protein
MGRRWILLAVAAAAVAAILLALYFLRQAPAPTPPAQPPPAQPQQPVEVPVGVNATQPAERAERPQPPVIVAVVEAGGGGRVLVNGTEAGVVSSTRPFSLVLEAAPEECYAFDHWLVNGTRLAENPLTLTITGNTTVRVVFARPLYAVRITANLTGAQVLVNGTLYALPQDVLLPACSVVEVRPLATRLFEPLNETTTLPVATNNTVVHLLFRVRSGYKLPLYSNLQVYVNGTPQPALAFESPFLLHKGTAEMQDGWMHLNGTHLLYIYVPLNYTVVVESRGVVGTLYVDRFCNETFAYAVTLDSRRPSVTFTGCKPSWYEATITCARIFDFNIPGILRISLANAPGQPAEAWVKIEAYP